VTVVQAVTALCVLLLLPLSGFAGSDPLAEFDIGVDTSDEKLYSINGYVEYSGRYAYGEGDFLRNRVKLFAEGSYSKKLFSFYASGYGWRNTAPSDWRGAESKADIYEAYISFDSDKFDISAGKKMLRWGTSDGINPIDLINPKDHLHPFSGVRSDSKLPVWLVDSVYTGDKISLELVVIPSAAVAKLPERGSPWEPQALGEYRESNAVKDTDAPKAAEFASRVFTTVNGYDLALLYFRGYEDSPVIKGDKLVYEKLEAYGFNFAKGLNKGTLRGEVVLKESSFYRYDYLVAVIGTDRYFDDNEYLNLQLFADNGEKERQGVTYDLYDTYIRGDIKAGFKGSHYFSDKSGTNEIYFQYLYGDSITIKFGAVYIYGKRDSVFGQFSGNDYTYLEVKYSF